MRNHTTSTIVGRVAGALALAAALAFTASPAQAEQEATTVSAFSGGLVSSVPIAVPLFRGVEPKIRVGYGSQSGNGFLGVGWSLAGPSYIERMSAGKGAPGYTTADVYSLDGNELVTSTLLGGTHCTKVQSYDRITFDSAANKWYVTNREGTKSTYSALYTTALGTFRWLLTEVRDVKNSYATYSWSCVGSPTQECYLNTITYNGNTITFYKELRTDYITYANGYTMGSMAYRLRSIAVKVGTTLVRVYKLGYAYSTVTQRSILKSIQQCGKDAVVDTAGGVTGGTCLPAMTLSGHSGGSALALGWGSTNVGTYSTAIEWLTGDLNADGKTDLIQAYASGSTMAYKFYNSSGCGYAYDSSFVSANTSAKVALLSGDVTRDGKANIVHAWNNGGYLAVAVHGSGGGGTCYETCYQTCYDSYGYPYSCNPYSCNPYACSASYGQVWSTTNIGQTATAEKFFLADVTGDGGPDLVQATRSSNTVGFKIYKANYNVTTGAFTGFTYLWGSTNVATPGTFQQFYIGDVNGDGKADMIESYAGGIAVFQSTGSAFTYKGVSSTGTLPTPLVRYAGDMNGDGKIDIFNIENSSGNLYMRVYVSNGRTYNLGYAASLGYSSTNLSLIPADVNGDGRTDLVQAYEATSYRVGFRTFTSRGTSYAYASGTTNAGQGTQNTPLTWLAPDYNGDGKADVVLAWKNATYQGLSAFKTANSFPDLVGTIYNGLGGSTTITYLPSSNWSDNMLAEGMVFSSVASVTNNDGRGDAQATTYTYAGAKFDIPSREFLGFRKAVTVLAATGAYSETYYWQRVGTIAKPEVIYKRKANGSILTFEKFTFTENSSPPYTSNVTSIWVYQCNGNGVVDSNHNYVSGCRRIYSTYYWDTYGNLYQERQYGNYDLTGDERTAYRSFVPNTSKYITNSPAYENMYQGLGTAGTLLARTRFMYDGATSEATAPTEGKLTKKSLWNSQTGTYFDHSFGYDAYGNETSVTDPLGRTSTKVYDATYHVYTTSITNPLGHTTANTWDYVLGLPTNTKDADLNATYHYYDPLGRATLTTQSSGRQVKVEYLNMGSATTQKIRTSVLTPGSVWIWDDTYQDGMGREYKTVSMSGVTGDTIYGSNGKVWKQTAPYLAGETIRYDVTTYDEIGREISVTRADGKVITRSYDDGITKNTDPTGNIRTAYWDAYGRITKVNEVIAGVNKVTSFYYDLLGRRTKSIGPQGHVTTAVYDSVGRLLSKSDPDQGAYAFTYNALGQVVTEKDALGKTTTLSYDNLGRVTKRAYADGRWDKFTFDETGRGSAKGRLTTAISRCTTASQTTCNVDAASSVTTKGFYDNMGRRTKFSQKIGTGTERSISHSYDIAGRVWTITYPDGETVGYTYGTSGTSLGRLTGMTGSVAGALLSNVTYTARGQMATMTYANGVTTTFNRDAYGENTTSVQIGSLATMSYGYDSLGRLTSFSSAALQDWTYGYDTIGRLTRATNTDGANTQTFTYDAAGRMLNNSKVGTYTYGATAHPHAVTAAGSNTYAYDANGNMTSGAGRTYTYYMDHRPATITAGGLTTSFLYDAQGLRVKKSSSQRTVEYVGSVYESSGSAVTKYYFAGGLRIAKRDANGNSYFHTDHLGSLRLVSNASGVEVKRYEYAPFGAVLSETGSRPDSHRFTGHEADDETGLMFFQARYYDPALGRFVQPDPIVPDANAPQSLDLYQYANNAPVNYVDPSGHAPLVAAVIAFVAAHAVAIACIIIGTALTFTNNPFLQTIGMIMCGVATAGMGAPLLGLGRTATMWVAGAVALAQSPISPLDPTIKKAIGWAYTIWGGVTSIKNMKANGMFNFKNPNNNKFLSFLNNFGKGSYAYAVLALTIKDVAFTAGALTVAYYVSKGSANMRMAFAYIAKALVFWSNSSPGPLAMIGSTYDLVYTLKYPDGRVIDLSGGEGGEMFTFYYHTGFESNSAYGRQHIRVGDSKGGYWELGDTSAGWFGPGLGWAGWITTQKVTVIMSPTQAAAFRQALTVGSQSNAGYIGLHRDSYAYISNALEFATGKSAADIHINPGLIHW